MGLVLIMSAACSGSESATSLTELGVDDGASEGASVQKSIAAGAEATLELHTGAKVRIPAGSTGKELSIGLKRPSDDDALSLVKMLKDHDKLASAPYVLTPHGSNFDNDVEVTLPIAKGRSSEKLKVAWLEDEQDTSWEVIGAPEVEGDKATIKVKHFSVFALVESSGGSVAVELDGGVGPSNGTGGDGGRADASTQTDGSTQTDAGLQFDGGTLDFSQTLYTKLQSCGMVERAGDFAPIEVDEADEACEFNCLAGASCQDFGAAVCDEDSGSPVFSSAFESCLVACNGGVPFVETTPNFCGEGLDAELCDGWEDCSDGRDENGCAAGIHFNCGNGDRVPVRHACDGYEDCTDRTDENNCPAGTHFICANGTRAPAAERCDGNYDCSDESDEANCPADHYFDCGDGKRVPRGLTCDANSDCANGADEVDCAGKVFACADGSDRMTMENVCDGDRDCSDGSDEPSHCAQLSCAFDL